MLKSWPAGNADGGRLPGWTTTAKERYRAIEDRSCPAHRHLDLRDGKLRKEDGLRRDCPQHEIGVNAEKTATVQQGPASQRVREVCAFPQLTFYYQRLLKNFAGNFNLLNRALVSPLVKGNLNFDRLCLLDIEDSDDAISAVFSQQLRGTSGDTYMVEGLQPERQTVPEFDFEVAVWPKKKYQNVGRFPDLLARSVPPVMTPETSTWNQKRRTVA
ncbi:hypothetical protein T4B_10379 [Trichinella pseudospiralis]|uniref:Uncharacterized protein n=1 Tax=Trichinella pseudospiralis TaxID=6337 RepID=A0A0V1GY63_TRIPS|nr:hypothetical protein T4B_10379 [Trichinella pseudospiralis]